MNLNAPILSVRRDASNQTVLEWPLEFASWTLEESESLENPTWEKSFPALVIEDRHQVILDESRETPFTRFFRLIREDQIAPNLLPIPSQVAPLGQTLRFQAQAEGGSGPLSYFAYPIPNGALLDSTSGEFAFRPSPSQVGTFNLTLSVSDGQYTDSRSFQIQVPAIEPGQDTSIRGVVLDTTSATQGNLVPIAGVTVRFLNQELTTVTDSEGQFVLTSVTGGRQILDLDASSAVPGPDNARYAGFREEIELIDGTLNDIDRPFYLPRLALQSLTRVNPEGTTVVINSDLGAVLTIPPGTARSGETAFDGELSISLVPEALAPAALPDELGFGTLVTIQPVGVTFSQPVRLTLANTDGFPPGMELDLWSLDAGTGQFVVVGRGRVSADGQRIETIQGGIRASDWHGFLATRPPIPDAGQNDRNTQNPSKAPCVPGASLVYLYDGNTRVEFEVPFIQSLSRNFGPRWVYHTVRANPWLVIPFESSKIEGALPPQVISARFSFSGLGEQTVYYDTSNWQWQQEEKLRGTAVFSASELPTDLYPLELRLANHWGQSSSAVRVPMELLVVNEQQSPFGSGWGLAGLQRLESLDDGRALVIDGDGSAHVFGKPHPGWIQQDPTRLLAEDITTSSAITALKDRRVAVVRQSILTVFNQDGGADWGYNFSLNDFGKFASSPHHLATLADGSIVVLGMSIIGQGTVNTFRIFDPNGTPRSDYVPIHPSGHPFTPDSTGFTLPLPNGNFMVIWNSLRLARSESLGTDPSGNPLLNQPTDWDVMARLFDASGNPIPNAFSPNGSEFAITKNPIPLPDGNLINGVSGSQLVWDAVALPDSSVVVAYRGPLWKNFGGSNWQPIINPFLIRISADALIWNQKAVRPEPEATWNASLNAIQVIVRENDTLTAFYNESVITAPNSPNQYPLLARHFGLDGQALNSPIADLNLVLSGSELSVQVENAPNNGYLLLHSQSIPTGSSLHLSRFDAADQLLEEIPLRTEPFNNALRGFSQAHSGEWFILTRNRFNLGIPAPDRLLLQRFFENPDGPDAYASPRGDPSVLKSRASGGWTRSWPDGSRVEFDSSGRHLATLDAASNSISFQYNDDGLLAAISDGPLQTWTLDYHQGRVSRLTDPSGRESHFSYDTDGNLVHVLLPNATERRFGYDGRHLMIQEDDANGQRVRRDFDEYGMFETAIRPDASRLAIIPTARLGLGGTQTQPALPLRPEQAMAIVQDGEGRVQRSRIPPGGAGQTAETDSAGLETIVSRDVDGNIVEWRYPSGHRISATYDRSGNPLQISDSHFGSRVQMTYEPLQSRIETFTDSYNNTTRWTFDSIGHPSSVTTPLGRHISLAWDPQGLPLEITHFDNAKTRFEHNPQGNRATLIQGEGDTLRQTTIEYNSQGLPTQIEDPLGATVQLEYDPQNRLTTQSQSGARITHLTYDQEGFPTSVQRQGAGIHRMNWTYDGRLTEYIPPPVGDEPDSKRWEYDRSGLPLAYHRPDGSSVTLQYDTAGRPIAAQVGRGQHTYEWSDQSGHILSHTSADGIRIRMSYHGELIQNLTWEGEVEGTLDVARDRNGRIDTLAVNEQSIQYTYNADGEQTRIGDLSVEYGAAPNRIHSTAIGNIATQREYNGFGEVIAETIRIAGQDFFKVEYERDATGRIIHRAETRDGNLREWSFTYDAAKRLASVSHPNGDTTSYTYDANGNRLARSTSLRTEIGSFDNRDRVLSYADQSYLYNSSGEISQISDTSLTTSYEHDESGQLLRVQRSDGLTIDYSLDASQRRTIKRVNGEIDRKYLWQNPLRIAAELDANNQVLCRMVYGSRPNLPEYLIKNGATYRILADELGSVRFVIHTVTGEIAQELEYDEYGRVLKDTAPGFQPFGYAGGLYDVHTGWVRFGLRDYDPNTGRWTTPDPILLLGGGDTNLYAYVANDPINNTDPTGLVNWKRALTGGFQIIGGITSILAGGLSTFTGPGVILAPGLVIAGLWQTTAGLTNLITSFTDHSTPELPSTPIEGLTQNSSPPVKFGATLADVAIGLALGKVDSLGKVPKLLEGASHLGNAYSTTNAGSELGNEISEGMGAPNNL